MSSTKSLFEQALEAEGVTGPLADIARSIYKQESGSGTNTRTSNAGAVGGMQILPGTFREVADRGWNINDPLQNARAGIRYVRKMHTLAGGDPSLTAAGYYGGPGGLEKARTGVPVSDPRNPNAPTTLEYARQVTARLPGAQPVPTGAAFGRYPSSGSARQPVVVPPDVRASTMPPVGPAQLKPEAPIPVVAEAPLPAFDTRPNAWAEFQRTYQAQAPVRPENLSWGEMRMPQVAVPDYMGTVEQSGPVASPNFSAFGAIGRRARV
jgi:hypothetical protein